MKKILYDNDYYDSLPRTGVDLMDYGMDLAIPYLEEESLTAVAKKLGMESPELASAYEITEAYYSADKELKIEIADEIVEEVHDAMASDIDMQHGFDDDIIIDMDFACVDMGLLKKDEPYLILGSGMGWRSLSGYKITDNIFSAKDIIDNLHGDYDFRARVYREDDKPYLNATVYSHDAPMGESYTIIPMQWMEKALESDVGKNIKAIMLQDVEVRDAVRDAVPSLTEGKEAITALEDFVISEAIEAQDTLLDIKELSRELASFNFLIFKEDVDNDELSNKYGETSYYDLAANAFFNGGDYSHFDAGDYRLDGKPDEKLIQGIENVLREKNPEKIKKMVDGLFGKDRVNTVHALKTLVSKEMAR